MSSRPAAPPPRAACWRLPARIHAVARPAVARPPRSTAQPRPTARRYHPDVAGQSIDSERRFVSIQQAYEVLTGKRQAPVSGAYTRNQHNGWEFQDW